MTIEKQPPGLWFLFCDSCGERIELDVDPDDDNGFILAVEEAKNVHRYRIREESHHYKFTNAHTSQHKYGPVWTHTCRDCVSAEPRATLQQISSMSDQHIDLKSSRPYRLGWEAFERGESRDSNSCWGPTTRTKWYIGWDEARSQAQADKLGVS